MPEGPELHLASLFVNKMCEGVLFSGPVRKSEVSKNPDVAFACDAYRISAASRGKEVKLTLTPIKSDDTKAKEAQQPMDIVFRFGMSGFFRFTAEDELPKHAHLCFYSKEKPSRVLSYVDARRFGSWQPHGTWQPDRGPCIMFEYESFRSNIPPFVPARIVLEGLGSDDTCKDKKPLKNDILNRKAVTTARKITMKDEHADLLRLCHTVPMEVVHLGGKGYDPEKADYSEFEAWLQCYYVDGMKSIRDHNGRTIWFKGDPGPMAPKDSKSPKAKKRTKKDEEHDYTSKKKGGGTQSESAGMKKEIKVAKTKKNEQATPPRTAKSLKVNTPPREDKSPARRRKTTKLAEGSRRRSGRLTRQTVK
ncbi:endonuclease 8-like 1 isoform X4 [Festucalex cinctus]